MINGSRDFTGSPILSNMAILMLFMSTVLSLAQEDDFEIPFLDKVHTYLCWPTFFEGILLLACLWSFRHIERLLGQKSFIIYQFYAFIAYLPVFFFIIAIKKYRYHFSFFYFVPYSLFAFMFWQIPATMISPPITDKIMISMVMAMIVSTKLPYSILAFGSGIIGFYLWNNDILQLRRLTSTVRSMQITFNNDRVSIEINEDNDQEPSTPLQELVSMGFSEQAALDALRYTNNDVQSAVEYLMNNY